MNKFSIRNRFFLSDIEFETRLWLEHVCKVCARYTLLILDVKPFGGLRPPGIDYGYFFEGFYNIYSLLGGPNRNVAGIL